ncbi:MAG: hypothetical protein IPO87_07850, partial [Flavobacteriales bacterium]|nr:hypothetical protein [Flavobacteriales bacterium]
FSRGWTLDGNLITEHHLGRIALEEARALVAMGNGQFVAAGWTTSYGAFNPTLNAIPAHVHLGRG